MKAAANQLGIPYYSLPTWRNNRKKYNSDTYVGSGHKRMSADNKERRTLELEKDPAICSGKSEYVEDVEVCVQRGRIFLM